MRATSKAPFSRMSRAASAGTMPACAIASAAAAFDLQPRFVSPLVAPDATHFRVGVALNHRQERLAAETWQPALRRETSVARRWPAVFLIPRRQALPRNLRSPTAPKPWPTASRRRRGPAPRARRRPASPSRRSSVSSRLNCRSKYISWRARCDMRLEVLSSSEHQAALQVILGAPQFGLGHRIVLQAPPVRAPRRRSARPRLRWRSRRKS